ncbi:unnamed protein product, partial [Callosobruchus maculatus]
LAIPCQKLFLLFEIILSAVFETCIFLLFSDRPTTYPTKSASRSFAWKIWCLAFVVVFVTVKVIFVTTKDSRIEKITVNRRYFCLITVSQSLL